MYQTDPELIFLKWAFKAGSLDADQLLEFNRRSASERPDDFLVELLLEWDYLTRDEMVALLDPDRLQRAVADGRLDPKLVGYLESIEVPDR